MTSLTVLRLRTTDLGLIEQQLRAKVAPLPQFFLDAPVVIDPSALDGGGDGLAWGGLAAVLRMLHLIPVGVTNVAEEHRAAISVARLPVMPLGAGRMRDLDARPQSQGDVTVVKAAPGNRSENRAQRSAEEPPVGAKTSTPTNTATPTPTPTPAGKGGVHRPPLVVRQPVRSGQVVYARRGDLVVLAPVNPGAEVIADGHVHIYAPLRGRAIAGAQGFTEARIFCQRMEAEILSIAGAYLLADDIPEERRGRPVQVFLDEAGECRMAAL
jgi:septum site-determining protein MinC